MIRDETIRSAAIYAVRWASRFGCVFECQQLGSLGQFLALKKYQLALNYLTFPIAFQADDDGSIPFTRSNVLNDLEGVALGIVSSRAVALCLGAAISRQANLIKDTRTHFPTRARRHRVRRLSGQVLARLSFRPSLRSTPRLIISALSVGFMPLIDKVSARCSASIPSRRSGSSSDNQRRSST